MAAACRVRVPDGAVTAGSAAKINTAGPRQLLYHIGSSAYLQRAATCTLPRVGSLSIRCHDSHRWSPLSGPTVRSSIRRPSRATTGGRQQLLLVTAGVSGFMGWAAPLAARAKVTAPGAIAAEGGAGGSSGNNGHGGGGGGGDGSGNSSGGDGRFRNGNGTSAAAGGHEESQGGAANRLREDVILLDISGMKCGGCVGRVKRLLEEVPEVSSASVNLATETALVRVVLPETGSPSGPSECLDQLRQTLCDILAKAGFKATVRENGASNGNASADRILDQKRAERMERLREATIRLAVAGALASTCLLHHLCHWFPSAPAWLAVLGSTPVQAGISAAALLGPGRQILVDGFRGIVHGAPDMNSLVGLGAVASFGMSCVATALPRLGWPTFFEEPAMLIGVVLLGKTLEERAKLAASSDMASLQRLLPSMANLMLENGATRQVPSDVLQTSDMVVLKPGERAPVDGVVVSGSSTVDEAALTGEPLPVSKKKGSEVMAGTVNVDGTLVVQATACGSDTAIADVVRLVEEAQARTAPVQRLADKVSGVFAYGVMGASLATFVFWATVGTRVFPQVLSAKLMPAAAAAGMSAAPQLGAKLLLSLQLACNVLVVACPCALGLATPTAVLVGTSAAAKQGLLIRGGDVLETASKLDTVVFDKTGTLTSGRPTVVDIETCGRFSQEMLMSHVAAVERNTPHPLAKAMVAQAESEDTPLLAVQDGSFRQEPGSGACATVGSSQVLVGNKEWLETHGVLLPALASTAPGRGTHVHVAVGGEYAGRVTLQDEVREGAAHVVATLQKMGVRPVMLSGDTEEAARAVGASLGFSEDAIYGGVKPAGKDAVVARLKEEGGQVAMVGDGVNDTAALARADVGIAMGGGVDAASEVADIVLLGDRITQVMDALQISKATFHKIQQNLCWAFGYNLIGIPVAAGALLPSLGFALTPSISGAVMAFSSVAVMSNSLLLQLEAKKQARRSMEAEASGKTPDSSLEEGEATSTVKDEAANQAVGAMSTRSSSGDQNDMDRVDIIVR